MVVKIDFDSSAELLYLFVKISSPNFFGGCFADWYLGRQKID